MKLPSKEPSLQPKKMQLYNSNASATAENMALCGLYGADHRVADPNFVRDFHACYSKRPDLFDCPQVIVPYQIPAGQPGAGGFNIGFPEGTAMTPCIIPARAAGRGAECMNGLASKGAGEWQYKRRARALEVIPLPDWDQKVTA